MNTTELITRLKAAAEKASDGEWVKESGEGWEAVCNANDRANSGFIIAHFEGPDASANREFVQAANPVNVLALVEALESAQHESAVNWEAATSLVEENEELKRRIAELEARTVTVKLPEVRITVSESRRRNLNWRELGAYNEGAEVAVEKMVRALAAVGIKCEVKGE